MFSGNTKSCIAQTTALVLCQRFTLCPQMSSSLGYYLAKKAEFFVAFIITPGGIMLWQKLNTCLHTAAIVRLRWKPIFVDKIIRPVRRLPDKRVIRATKPLSGGPQSNTSTVHFVAVTQVTCINAVKLYIILIATPQNSKIAEHHFLISHLQRLLLAIYTMSGKRGHSTFASNFAIY